MVLKDTYFKKRILVVDDDDDDFLIISDYINNIPSGNYLLEWCDNYHDALGKLSSNSYDLYFLDFRLGIKTGMDLLKESIAAGCEMPIVLLTGKGTQEIDVKAMEAGAYDFLVKSDITSEKLERCIRYSLERAGSIKALKANERKYRNIFEKSNDVVFITDSRFNIIDINYAATKLFDFEREELLQTDISLLFRLENAAVYFRDVLPEFGELEDFEVDLVSKTGEIKNCIISASFEVSEGGPAYIQGVIHDNTNRKRAERNAMQAEKQAATTRLIRTLAHEVRNPLNNINLALEQLIEIVVEEETAMYLQIVQRNSKRIGSLIDELLTTSSISSQIHLKMEALQGVLEEAIASAIDKMSLKHITLEKDFSNEAAMVMVDKEKVNLAILNIIVNSIEAMDPGRGLLKISVKRGEDEHTVEITDNGCGISEENMQRLFEPYFTSKRNGMGLGLASSLNILQAHNANIEVKSEEGKGSSFILHFKIAK